MLSRSDGEVEPVLGAGTAWLRRNVDETEIREIRAMETPLLVPALDTLAFQALDFKFGFAAAPIDEDLALDELEPTGWWITAGD